MTRNGKIARLSFELREELNERILNGEPGNTLLDWLNDQDEAFELVEAHFAGVPISDQNLSEWKAGGYLAWLANREARETVLLLAGQSRDLGEASEEANMGQCLSNLLMVEFIKLARVLVEKEEDPEKRWKQLRTVNRELCRLRKTNMRGELLEMRRQRSEWEAEDRQTAEEEKHAAWVKQQRLARYTLLPEVALRAKSFKDEEAGWNCTAHELEIENDLPFGFLEKSKGDGYWVWEEDEEKWFWWRTGDGKTPSTKDQAPEKPQKPKTKGKKAKSSKSKNQAEKGENIQYPTSNIQPPMEGSGEEDGGLERGQEKNGNIQQPTSNIQQPMEETKEGSNVANDGNPEPIPGGSN